MFPINTQHSTDDVLENINYLLSNLILSLPEEGDYRSSPDEGDYRSLPDEGYYRSLPDEGDYRSLPDEGYFRNAS